LFDAANGSPQPPEVTWTTYYYGGGSIFSFVLSDETSLMRANKPYESPYRARLSAPVDDFEGGDEDADSGED
jgi:hypothetical protein